MSTRVEELAKWLEWYGIGTGSGDKFVEAAALLRSQERKIEVLEEALTEACDGVDWWPAEVDPFDWGKLSDEDRIVARMEWAKQEAVRRIAIRHSDLSSSSTGPANEVKKVDNFDTLEEENDED